MKKLICCLTALFIAGSQLIIYPQIYNPDINILEAASNQISENGIALIKGFEGYSQYAYWDSSQWTIGYGTGVTSKNTYPDGITESEADRLLRNVVIRYEGYVQTFLNKYNISVTQNQYDALVSFTYNLGNVWKYSSEVTIRTYLINGISNYTDQQIKDAFKLWCKSGGSVLPGLLIRREKEAELFLSDKHTEELKGEQWRITSATGVRFRITASTSADVDAVIPYNAVINVSEKQNGEGFLWGKTIYNGKPGWCVLDYADYIRGKVETTTIPDEDKYEQWRIVSDTGVNLRLTASLSSQILNVVPYNAIIKVYEKYDDGKYIWARTEYNGKPGWCVLNYASKVQNTSDNVKINGIRIQTLPSKMNYKAGEVFDNSGMIVIAVLSDGTEKNVSDYGCKGNTNLPGISIITVEYQGVTADFSVLVNSAKGDINLNGAFDIEDNFFIKKYLLNDNVDESVKQQGDINGDGMINVFDSMHLKKKYFN